MNRRDLLRAAGAAGAVSLAGCAGLFGTTTTNSREPPLVENRPDAVYVPTHREGMKPIGMARAGDLMVATSYSYAHRFWPVENEGGEYVAKRQDVERDDAVHLMTRVWEPETGVVIPDAGVTVALARDGESVFEEVVYPMLSQRMGVHYGDNAPVGGDGTHQLSVTVGGLDDLARFGAFEGTFGSAATANFEWTYSEAERNKIPFELLEEKQGTRGALDTMEMSMGDGMSMPMGSAPTPDSLPGAALGEATAGDLRFVGRVAEADRFGDDPYLLVSPRTRYHAYVLGAMGLSATVSDGKFDGTLQPGLDPEAGYHYGASVPGLAADDTVELGVDTPPVVARHEGYETAFFDVGPVTLSG
nr:Tat pathway signal protein [Halobium salinum]